jgi:hypothetical protein
MTLPPQEHNSLIATREFLNLLLDKKRFPDLDERIVASATSLLEHYPNRSRLDELYTNNTFDCKIPEEYSLKTEKKSSTKIVNNNQTWKTPGFKWKTEVEFLPADRSRVINTEPTSNIDPGTRLLHPNIEIETVSS